MKPGTPVAVGQVRVHRALRTHARYRVLAHDGDHALVEVIEAPNLRPGARFRFREADVAAMELVEPARPGDHAAP